MNTTIFHDHDGLPRAQRAKIDRILAARHSEPWKQEKRFLGHLWLVLVMFLCWVIFWAGMNYGISKHWSPGTELYTRLPALDRQRPSLTVLP